MSPDAEQMRFMQMFSNRFGIELINRQCKWAILIKYVIMLGNENTVLCAIFPKEIPIIE